LAVEKSVGTGRKLPPNVNTEKSSDFKRKTGVL